MDCDNKAGKPRYVEFYGKDYKAFPYLRKFGEIGIVTQGDAIKSKLVNRGMACLYLGHADNHSAEVSRFMKLSTKRVICSRDVKWLNKTFKEYQESEGLYKDDEEDDSDCSNNSIRTNTEIKSSDYENDDNGKGGKDGFYISPCLVSERLCVSQAGTI